MEDEGSNSNQWKRQNVFGVFVDKPLGYPTFSSADAEHDHNKKLKTNFEAPLSNLDQQVPSLPLPNLLVSAFKENPAGVVKLKLFVTRSYSPSSSTSPPPVYTLKITSASNSGEEVESAANKVDGGATPVVTETRLVAEGQFSLRSRL